MLWLSLVCIGLVLTTATGVVEGRSAGPESTPVLDKAGKVVHDEAWLERRKEYIQGSAPWQPGHVHLAYGHETKEMVVTYSTPEDTRASLVEYGTDMFSLHLRGQGNSTKFVSAGSEGHTQFIHRVHLHHLQPNTTYYYHVGCEQGWSPVFGFRTVPAGTEGWELRLAVLGDLGATNARSLNRLQQEAHQGLHHAVIHVGDFAYNMEYNDGHLGDTFMEQMEPVTAYVPYMTCPGNHESANDFLQYRKRFSMPNYTDTESLYFSFNIGPVHFVSVSSEVYFYDDPINRSRAQFDWLVADLKAATTPAARQQRPWIIMYAHRPMYCSNSDDPTECETPASVFRAGMEVEGERRYGMESLLMEYSVDLFIGAHEHSYERLFPMFNYTYYRGDGSSNYINPRAPPHIITGSAGCWSDFDHFTLNQPMWSAYRLDEYGYTTLRIANRTHLYMQQVSDENDVILDTMTLVREDHTRYPTTN